MEIVLATRNKNKIKEIKKILEDLNITFLSLEDLNNKILVDEDCPTIRENAIKKAKEVAMGLNRFALADDSGLEVDALDGNPGVFSARFAGIGCAYKDNNIKLLRFLNGVPLKKRNARFRCVFAFADKNGLIKVTEGICNGKITFKEIGRNGFGYDPVFKPDRYNKTFAQMNMDKKNRISHRAKACHKMKNFLKRYLKIKPS